ncbi:MAG: BsuPI-related putative proteinase inhibitor [Halanaerobiaceae bacterium]
MTNKFLLAVITLLVIFSITFTLMAEDFFVNEKKLNFDITPDKITEDTLIPLEKMQEIIQFRMIKLSPAKTAICYDQEYYIINLDTKKVQSGSRSYSLKPEPREINGYLLLPLSFFTGILNIEVNYDSSQSEVEEDIMLTLKLEKDTFESGENIEGKLVLENKSDEPRNFTFSSSQKYDFIIEDKEGKQVKKWSDGRMFAQVITEMMLEPGTEKSFTEEISISDLREGIYYLYGLLPAEEEIVSEKKEIRIEK